MRRSHSRIDGISSQSIPTTAGLVASHCGGTPRPPRRRRAPVRARAVGDVASGGLLTEEREARCSCGESAEYKGV